jgi:hypothetical protein
MKQDTFTCLTAFLRSLERGKIHYALQSCRDEAIMVLVTVPGERWEVEFLADGSVEIERFISGGEIYGEDILGKLLTKNTDQEGEGSEASEGTELPVATGQALKNQEIRAAQISALRGKYRHTLTPSDACARQKQEDSTLGRDVK